jgi:hypothetical protein
MTSQTSCMTTKGSTRSGRDNETPLPAFDSDGQALCFLVLVIFALLLPVIITNYGRISRRDSYHIMHETLGNYTFVENEVFNNKEDIDILFIGSSFIWAAIDAPQVQKELTAALGRPARVMTFGHSFNSIDIPYMQLRDLLERKHVKLVILSVPRIEYTDGPSITAYKFLRYSENKDVVDELPFKYRVPLYGSSVLRAPHDLLTMSRRNVSEPSSLGADLGALKKQQIWGQKPFEEFNPSQPFIISANLIYSPATQDQFQFTNDEITFYQNHYLKKLVELLKREQVSLAMVNIPQYSEKESVKVIERIDWSKSFGVDVPLIGIPPATLFGGLSEEDIKKLHYNEHMNKNGNEFFTRTILPAILEVYKTHASKN